MDDATFDGNDQRPDKPRGVPKARLASLELDPKISIYHQIGRGELNHELVREFPKAAATLFSNKIFKSMRNDDLESKKSLYTITGGDKDALKLIFQWIQECVDQQTVLKFPEIPEPDHDPFQPTLNVLVAANLLEIPAGSLSFFVERRLHFLARKHLMSFDQVYEFYDTGSEFKKMNLQKVACASVFNAWWDARLDESVNPELMEELADLRDHYPELDQDLHDACDEKKAAIEKSRLERRLKREAEQNGDQQPYNPGATSEIAGNEFAGFGGENANTGAGWSTSPTEVNSNTDWTRDGIAEKGIQSWSNDNPAHGEWADEVNEQAQQFVPTASAW